MVPAQCDEIPVIERLHANLHSMHGYGWGLWWMHITYRHSGDAGVADAFEVVAGRGARIAFKRDLPASKLWCNAIIFIPSLIRHLCMGLERA